MLCACVAGPGLFANRRYYHASWCAWGNSVQMRITPTERRRHGSKSSAKSNLTVNAALYEDVRCKLNDAENTIWDLNEKVAGLEDELDTAKHFRLVLNTRRRHTATSTGWRSCPPSLGSRVPGKRLPRYLVGCICLSIQ